MSMLKRKEVDTKLLDHTEQLKKQIDVHEAIREAKTILKKQKKEQSSRSPTQKFVNSMLEYSKLDLETNQPVERAELQSLQISEGTSLHSFGTKQKQILSHLETQKKLSGVAKQRLNLMGYKFHHSLKK